MKWIFLSCFVILFIAVWKFYPMVRKEKACYDTAQSTINDIKYYAVARNSGKDELCLRRSNALMDLDDCIRVATSGSSLVRYVNGIIDGTVYLIRPLTESLSTQKAAHNTDCSEFEKYQLE